ncbi:hypothetical protein ABEX69_11595 [Bacillus safensis]|uniref:Uncharacterized protein n=1 Tax=Bacillus pumilus TaxID=1408 RepID=A0AAD0HL81_BACPU|nr:MULTISPECIES: hypothetical protein [Bacillus]APT49057.1 hypothetical protein BSA41_03580 [Bacillus safensis]APT54667.1 hypothetical protein BSA171_14135 [Bacillus safensis]AVM23321.1 hypothetical protein C5695_05560 [Bacillus pumilus]KIL24016.1 hypothetical protein B4133_0529 [Bacillus altitudinis]MBK4214124.1 hypothetical protein [Bacillus pumilus]
MEFLDFLVLGAKTDLPTLGGVQSWGKQVVTQFIFIVAMLLISKHLMKLSVGKMVGVLITTSAGVWVVQNWSTVTGWVGALLKKL